MNKKRQILGVNIFWLLLWYFLYKESSLLKEQILIFEIVRIFGINLLFFKNIFLKTIGGIGIIIAGFLVVIWFLPLYEKQPNEKGFQLTQTIWYQFRGNPNAVEIIEESSNGKQKIVIKDPSQKILFPESQKRTILLTETQNNPSNQNQLSISFPDGTILIISPWTEITIEKIDTIYTVSKNIGNIEYYLPEKNRSTNIRNTLPEEKKDKNTFSLSYLIQEYEHQQKKYIIQQGGWIIISRTTYQYLSREILEISYKIRPHIYEKNKKNYEEYKKILWWQQRNQEEYKEENRQQSLKDQIKKSLPETRTFN
jgi:hypothetical protein